MRFTHETVHAQLFPSFPSSHGQPSLHSFTDSHLLRRRFHFVLERNLKFEIKYFQISSVSPDANFQHISSVRIVHWYIMCNRFLLDARGKYRDRREASGSLVSEVPRISCKVTASGSCQNEIRRRRRSEKWERSRNATTDATGYPPHLSFVRISASILHANL